MATLPLAVGSVTGCEWEGMGKNFVRDNQGNGNLIWISQYTQLDIRVSKDNGATWTEPTALGTEGGFGSTWAQDSAGNLHGVLPNGTSNAKYRKITLTRTAGDITAATETTTLTLACVTDSALGRSWSIAVVSDGQATPVERVAIAWMDGKFAGAGSSQRLSVRCVVTTEAAGISPTAATDFKAFNESTATGELIRNDTGSSTGTATGFCTKIEQMPGTAAAAKWRLYVAVRAYDATNVSERFMKVYAAAWNNAASQPFWGAFAELATGATPAETEIHNIDLIPDATNNRVIFCGSDTALTTTRTLDLWTIDTAGTLDKNVTFAQVNFASLTNPIRSGKLALDQNGLLWAFAIENSTGDLIGVAQYSGGWVVNYQYANITVAPEDIVVPHKGNLSNRMFYACPMDHPSADPCVMSVALSAESKTVKTSGGSYDSLAAFEHAPDLMLYDHTLTFSWKSGGWMVGNDGWIAESALSGNNAQKTILANKTYLIQSDVADRHVGKWDTSKVWFGKTGGDYTLTLFNSAGSGVISLLGLQINLGSPTYIDPAALLVFGSVDAAANSAQIVVDKCIMRIGSGGSTAVPIRVENRSPKLLTVQFRNCVVLNMEPSNTDGAININANAGDTVDFLSGSVYTASTSLNGKGIRNADLAHAPTIKDTVVETASGTSDLAFSSAGGGWGTSDYNAAGGAAASNAAPGANSLSDLTAAQIAFVDKANGDLHIQDVEGFAAASSLKRAGTNLNATFRDDIDGNPRPYDTVAWDIGADQIWYPEHPSSAGLACGLARGLG